MEPLYLAITGITIALIAAIVVADLARAKFVLANSAEVGVPAGWLPGIATLKAAAVVGLALGLLGVRPIGIAAATGLVLFFICAVIAHVRAKVYYNIAFPGTYLALSAASLALAVMH